MRKTRIFYPGQLNLGDYVSLDTATSVRVGRVLRLNVGDTISLFNGTGGEYDCEINQLDKRVTICKLCRFHEYTVESPLSVTLAQGISKGERMDYTIQKAVELGVNEVIPLITTRTTVNLTAERRLRRRDHWQSVVHSACEQCGRNKVPDVQAVQEFSQWIANYDGIGKFVLDPRANVALNQLKQQEFRSVSLLVGPEGGLSEQELTMAEMNGFQRLRCGPRTLRTETAAVAILSVLQHLWGDFNT